MTVSVTELKARCLEIIRDLERDGEVVEIVRGGAKLLPATPARATAEKPWERLRGTGSSSPRPKKMSSTNDRSIRKSRTRNRFFMFESLLVCLNARASSRAVYSDARWDLAGS
jgi:antitoxin (DNA-binding transcriptional repressor) of toxin-antitoxin stability system